ncbi:hypothetical protein [Heyndrickxia acidiproducens]|uniref:hypothetical protein n=1 Tax=Heyndrickxia acidiproducens TaxID=1121084 RepID=UPI000373FCD0|nr:hypothetical protein [Heyndrickxia acidiproducens]
MLKINTFIKKPNLEVSNLEEMIENPYKYFIRIDNETEIKNLSKEIDFDYINGAITIQYYDRFIMDFSLWDLVDQLWSYFIKLVEEVLQTGYGTIFFPDQPVKVEMKTISNDMLLFSLAEGKIISVTLPKQEFLNALLNNAQMFFTKLTSYFKGNVNYSYEINKIKAIQEQLRH